MISQNRKKWKKNLKLMRKVQDHFNVVIILILYTKCVNSLVLQFDGSLRRQADPYKEIVSTALSSKLSPFATCSFAILKDDNEKGKIISLGGKEIPCDSRTTSADVEYEGFVLGLKGFLHICEHYEEKVLFENELTIRGDCKTVIDQMIGASMPRKQRSYYKEANSIIEQLETEHAIKLKFEHVSRDLNQLCDGMCKVIMQKMQDNVSSNFLRLLNQIEENYVEILVPKNRRKRLKFEETPFSEVLFLISDWDGHVPLSLRPYLLCEIYHASYRTKDFVAMRLVGEVMRNEAKRWARQNISNHITSEFDLIAVQIIYSGLSHLGLQKEAESILLQRNKYRSTEDLDVNWLQEQMPKLKAEDESVGIVLKNVIKRSDNDERKLNQWFKDSIQNNTSSSENPWIIFST